MPRAQSVQRYVLSQYHATLSWYHATRSIGTADFVLLGQRCYGVLALCTARRLLLPTQPLLLLPHAQLWRCCHRRHRRSHTLDPRP
eukprot:1110450-Rhodomonas_salina.2